MPKRTSRRTKGYEVIAWIEAHCRFTNGEWIGKPFRLLPWQKRLILELFEVGAGGLRRHRWAYVSTSKKAGKTELAAALALYMLIGDGEPSPLVICAAASEDQADLVFGAAKRMCELSPTLSQITERFDKEILVPSIPGAKLKRVAAAAGTNDGQNIHAVIVDELHEWTGPKGERVWTVLTNGTGARRQPLVFQITTAGWDLDTICGRQYLYAQRVAAGEEVDGRYYSFISEAPEGADHTDPAVWEVANPSFGVTVQPEFFADQLSKKPEADFRRYFCNQWTRAKASWLPPGAWETCRGPVSIADGAQVWVGVDVALKHDSTAVVLVAPDNTGRFHVQSRVWQPVDDRIDVAAVENHLRQLHQQYEVVEFAFDPAYFERSAQVLLDEGLRMVEFPQSPARMVPACQAAYELIAAALVVHDGDPTLTDHVLSAAQRESDRGWTLSKGRTKRKIDACIALVMALARAGTRTVEYGSVYETQDLAVF
jgi:phage terminase large subunit-like protein